MAKSLKDIIAPRAGRNVPKGEEDFLDNHKVDEKPYPHGNDKVFTAKVVKPEALSQKNDPGMRHGYRSLKAAAAAYEETVHEAKKKKPSKGLSQEDDRMTGEMPYSSQYASGGIKAEAKDPREYGYEGDMAISQLKSIMNHAKQMMDMLDPSTDLPEWVQSKITLACDYIQTAADYMSTEMHEEKKKTKIPPGQPAKTYPDMGELSAKVEEVEPVDEVLKKSDPAGKWISHFVHSKNPKFASKSKEKRIEMALGAKYAKMKEETEVSESTREPFGKFLAKNLDPSQSAGVKKKTDKKADSKADNDVPPLDDKVEK